MAMPLSGLNICANAIAGTERFLALSTSTNDANELTGNGYSRLAVTAAQLTVNASNATITVQSGLTVYTPNTDSAQDSTHVSLFDAATGGNRIMPWVMHTDINAPVNGQPVNTGTITFRLTST